MPAWPVVRPWAVVVVLGPLLLSGCFQALLREGPSTTLSFTCALMDPAQDDAIVVQSFLAPTAPSSLGIGAILGRLVTVLSNLTGRPPSIFSIDQQAGRDPPATGWNRSLLADQAGGFLRQRTVTFHILWVDSLRETGTGFVAGPGTVVVALDSVAAAADRLGRPLAQVAMGVLLHQVGHALGETNQGVPVQDRRILQREGPPGHDLDPASVLNMAWDDARTVTWAEGTTYDRYPATNVADWAAARSPGGVCT
jgi:hypothetical protein